MVLNVVNADVGQGTVDYSTRGVGHGCPCGPKTSEGVIRCHLRSEEVSRGNFSAFEEWILPKMVCETCKKTSL